MKPSSNIFKRAYQEAFSKFSTDAYPKCKISKEAKEYAARLKLSALSAMSIVDNTP